MVELMMPLSEEQAVMRTGLAHGILTAIAFNVNRRQTDLAFYEIGGFICRPEICCPMNRCIWVSV